jgi:bacterioferritin-associated ferredoxin
MTELDMQLKEGTEDDFLIPKGERPFSTVEELQKGYGNKTRCEDCFNAKKNMLKKRRQEKQTCMINCKEVIPPLQ